MAKGSSFEREICRALTNWWTGDPEADVLFWRTAMSGGRATVRRKKGKKTTKSHCGDIGALTEEGKPLTDLITFELKRGYRAANLHDLIDGAAKSPYLQWFAQARAAAREAGSASWMVIHKRDRKRTLAILPAKIFERLTESTTGGGLEHPAARYFIEYPCDAEQDYVTLNLVVLPFEAFFNHVDPSDVRRVHKAWLKRSSSRTASPTSGRPSSSTRTSRRS